MLLYLNYLVFARSFLHRRTLWIPQKHFQHVFAEKKVENNLLILHGLQTYQNGQFSEMALISRIYGYFLLGGFFHRTTLNAFLQIHFRHIIGEEKFLTQTLTYFAWAIDLPKWSILQNGLISRIYGCFFTAVFCT